MDLYLIFCLICSDEEHSPALPSVLKRRAQALIIFVGHALQTTLTKRLSDSPAREITGGLFSILVNIATLQGGLTPESNIDHISNAVQTTMSLSLSVMPAADFVNSVVNALESKEERVCLYPSILFSN